MLGLGLIAELGCVKLCITVFMQYFNGFIFMRIHSRIQSFIKTNKHQNYNTHDLTNIITTIFQPKNNIPHPNHLSVTTTINTSTPTTYDTQRISDERGHKTITNNSN